jgi:hypothetical protein
VTNEQLAEQMAVLARVQAETLQLMSRESERREAEMSELRQSQIDLSRGEIVLRELQIELREAQIETQRSLARLSDTVERFITRGGNGR